jgi:hypothetical protein
MRKGGKKGQAIHNGVLEMLIDCSAGSIKGKYVLEDVEIDGGENGRSLLG